MAIRISDLDPLGSGLKKNDKFEVTKTDEGKSYSCTPEDILNYCKNQSNGAFRGETANAGVSLDEMTKDYVGVWYWTMNNNEGPNPNSVRHGMLEITAHKSSEDMGNTIYVVQKISSEMTVYQRYMHSSSWSPWVSMGNMNGCRIRSDEAQCDSDGRAQVYFLQNHSAYFSGRPAVSVTPINNGSESIFVANVFQVDDSGFSVIIMESKYTDHKVTETVTAEQDGTTTTTKTVTIETQGQWTPAANAPFSWIALHEEG
jgi:hypothetical protein